MAANAPMIELPTIIPRAPGRRRADLDFDRLFNGLLDLDRANRSVAAADLYETEEVYGLELELPGFTEAEIDVTVDRGVLTVELPKSPEAKPHRVAVGSAN